MAKMAVNHRNRKKAFQIGHNNTLGSRYWAGTDERDPLSLFRAGLFSSEGRKNGLITNHILHIKSAPR